MGVAERIRDVCGKRLKMSQAEIDAIVGYLQTYSPDEQEGAFAQMVMQKERAVAVAENNERTHAIIAQDIAQNNSSPEMALNAAFRLLDSTASGGIGARGNRAVTSRASARQQAELDSRTPINVVARHEKVLKDRVKNRRVWQWLRNEIKDADLSADELAAGIEVKKSLIVQKAKANAARGIPQHLDDGVILPQRIRSVRLQQEAGETAAEKEDNFVRLMLEHLDDTDGFWGDHNGVRLRAYYRVKSKMKDGAIDQSEGSGLWVEQQGLKGIADREELPMEAFWDLDKRGFKFKDTDAEMWFYGRYNGAKNLNDLMATTAVINARNAASAKLLGTNLDKTAEVVEKQLKAAGVNNTDIGNWKRTLANFAGELDSLENATQVGQALSGLVSLGNVVRLDMAVLTLLSSQVRAFGHLSRTRGVTMGLLHSLDPIVNSPLIMKSAAAQEVLDAMCVANYKQMADALDNMRVIGGITDNEFGRGAGAETGAFLSRWARRGVLKWSGFEGIGERMRMAAAEADNIAMAKLFDEYGDFASLPRHIQNYLKEGNIGERDYAAAVSAYHGGGKRVVAGRNEITFNAIKDTEIANKWKARSNQIAAEVSGYAPLNLDAKLKMGRAGTSGRALANSAFGLLRDPMSGGLFLLRHINGHWEHNKMTALGFVGGFAATNILWAHFRSQAAHTITYGERHNFLETRPNEYLARLAAFSSMELFGQYFFNVPWAHNHAAALGGGPTWDDGIAAIQGVTNFGIHGDQSGIARFFADKNDAQARAASEFVRTYVPLPGFVKRPVAAAIHPTKQSSLALLGFGGR